MRPKTWRSASIDEPASIGVVVGETELRVFGGEREALDEADASVDTCKAAAAIFNAAGHDFDGHGGAGGDVAAEDPRVEVGADGVDVVDHQIAEVWLCVEEVAEDAVAEDVGDFVPVADGMEALEGEVVGVVGAFSALLRP